MGHDPPTRRRVSPGRRHFAGECGHVGDRADAAVVKGLEGSIWRLEVSIEIRLTMNA